MSTENYDRLARIYDPLLNPFLDSLRKAVRDTLLSLHLGVQKRQSRVVDLCCGTGRQAIFLQKAGMQVTGVDTSQAMLTVARQKSPEAIQYVHADAMVTGLETESFDTAVVSLALHELPEPIRQSILSEAMRLVRPGGKICVADYRVPCTTRGKGMLAPIILVERLAGKEHYQRYREYMQGGGTEELLNRAAMPFTLTSTRLSGCIGIYVVEHT